MQPPKVREVASRLIHDGFVLMRQRGGRRIYQKGDKVVTLHGSDNDRLLKGTWAEIQREAGWK